MQTRAARVYLLQLLLVALLPACTATPMPLPTDPDASRSLPDFGIHYAPADSGMPPTGFDRDGADKPTCDGGCNQADSAPEGGLRDGGGDRGDGSPVKELGWNELGSPPDAISPADQPKDFKPPGS